jgi:hypothetical protein
MNTAYLENGDHALQVEVFWAAPNTGDDSYESIYPCKYSDAITITVSNAIYYPQWEEDIGEPNICAFNVKTACTNADWTIDIYDVSSNFVNRLTGHTDDGTIDAYWNLVDTNGVVRTNADLDPEFSSVFTVADPASAMLPTKKHPRADWPDQGIWTVSYLDYFRHHYDQDGDMVGHINDFALTAGKYGGYYLWHPDTGQTNDVGQTYPLRFINDKHPEDNVTDDMVAKDHNFLLRMLGSTNSRNFFFRGHGAPNTIAGITSDQISGVVHHRYRFVLLQACHSAEGDLDHAFGIKGPESYNDISHYRAIGKRPAAFVGSIGESYFSNPGREQINGVWYDGRIPWQVPNFYYQFLFYWDNDLMSWDLLSALTQATEVLPPVDNWSNQWQPGRSLVVYGYDWLHIDEYNHATDWP